MATHYVTWKADGKECRYQGSYQDVREMRHFMLHVSPMQRDEISEVCPIARCPTCGRPVPSIFEHIDVDCETWPEDWTMADLKIPTSAASSPDAACRPSDAPHESKQ